MTLSTSELIEGITRRLGGPIAHDQELGIRYGLAPDGAVTGTINPHSVIEDGNDHVAQGVLATVLDTVSGIASMACLDFAETSATLDLRIDYLRPLPAGQELVAYAKPVGTVDPRRARSITIKGRVCVPSDDEPFAICVGRFFRLAHSSSPPRDMPQRELSSAQSYADLMSMTEAKDQSLILPFRDGLTGNGSLRALHGGVIVSLLQDCALRYARRAVERPLEIASVHVSFLQFGRSENLIAVPRPVRLGRNTATLNVVAHQGGGIKQPTAEATITLVTAQSRNC